MQADAEDLPEGVVAGERPCLGFVSPGFVPGNGDREQNGVHGQHRGFHGAEGSLAPPGK